MHASQGVGGRGTVFVSYWMKVLIVDALHINIKNIKTDLEISGPSVNADLLKWSIARCIGIGTKWLGGASNG